MSIRFAQMTLFNILWPSNILLYIFFIHSSVDGQLDCFHILAIVNSAAMDFEEHASFQSMVFSRVMTRSGIWGSYSSYIVTLRTSIIFPIVAVWSGSWKMGRIQTRGESRVGCFPAWRGSGVRIVPLKWVWNVYLTIRRIYPGRKSVYGREKWISDNINILCLKTPGKAQQRPLSYILVCNKKPL